MLDGSDLNIKTVNRPSKVENVFLTSELQSAVGGLQT